MGKAIIVGMGGAAALDSITANASDILAPKVGLNQDGDPITGTIRSKSLSPVVPSSKQQTITTNGFYITNDLFVKEVQNLTAANVKANATIADVKGTFTSDGTAVAKDILPGKTAYVNGNKITGTMATLGTPGCPARTITPTKSAQTIGVKDKYCYQEIEVQPIPYEYPNTSDGTAVAKDILPGKIAYVKGQRIVGTMSTYGNESLLLESYTPSKEGNYYLNLKHKYCLNDISFEKIPNQYKDTSDATAVAGNILTGKTAYISSGKITGTMKDNNKGASVGTLNNKIITLSDGNTYDADEPTNTDRYYAAFKIPAGYYNGQTYLAFPMDRPSSVTPVKSRVGSPPIQDNKTSLPGIVSVQSIPNDWLYDYDCYDEVFSYSSDGMYDSVLDLRTYNTVGEESIVNFPSRYDNFFETEPKTQKLIIRVYAGYFEENGTTFTNTVNSIISLNRTSIPDLCIIGRSWRSDLNFNYGVWRLKFDYDLNTKKVNIRINCLNRCSLTPDERSVRPIIRVTRQLTIYPDDVVINPRG